MIQPNEPIKRFEPLWGNWYADELLGEGSYGRVYRIVRHDGGGTYYSACKHITIPKNEAEVQNARAMGMDNRSTYTYFSDMASRILNEINIMYALRGESNIVTYEDHFIVHQEGSLKWDVFIRMELLIPLSAYIANNALGEDEIRRLGVEMCTALEACEAYKIIHRDIKEGNIFLNPRGTYKLGDFGIARELSSSNMSMSMRGTPSYVAPEVYNGQQYDATVDLYSLGILMYKLLNGGRYPFFPPAPQNITMESSEQAFALRMQGRVPPMPVYGSESIKSIVMKAISFSPRDRFPSASAMKAALTSGSTVAVPSPAFTGAAEQSGTLRAASQARIQYDAPGPVQPSDMQQPSPVKKKTNIAAIVGIAGGAALVVILIAVLLLGGSSRYAETYQQAVALEVAGNSEEALNLFLEVPNYEDSEDHINALRIALIDDDLAKGDAAAASALAEDVSFADENEAMFYRAKIYFAMGDYTSAFSEITSLCSSASAASTYEERLLADTGSWVAQHLTIDEAASLRSQFSGNRTALKYINNGIYIKADALLEVGQAEDALTLFKLLDSYSDAGDRADECIYTLASNAFDAGDYAGAYDLFYSITVYSDAADKATLSLYKLGCKQFTDGERDSAIDSLFRSISTGFTPDDGFIEANADEMYTLCQIYYSAGNYTLAQEGFIILGTYERSADYYTLCTVHIAGVSTYSLSELKPLIGFEDASSLILSDFDVAFAFLTGKWSCSSGYLQFEDGVGLTFSLSAPDFGDKWGISNGLIYFYNSSDPGTIKEAYSLTLNSENELSCYAYKNGKTYTLKRK